MNLQSFNFSFEPTGDKDIDLILSAVANAGKYFHSTEHWNDEAPYKSDDDLKGRTPIDWISNAAIDAAAANGSEVERLRAALVWVRANYASGPTRQINAHIDAALNQGASDGQ